jgi:hypothetical protein
MRAEIVDWPNEPRIRHAFFVSEKSNCFLMA